MEGEGGKSKGKNSNPAPDPVVHHILSTFAFRLSTLLRSFAGDYSTIQNRMAIKEGIYKKGTLPPTACTGGEWIVVSCPLNQYDQRSNQMNVLHERFSLTASDGEKIFGDIRVPSEGSSLPVLVIAHGFKGFKDWGFFPNVASAFAERGWYVVQFNFSHNGVEGHSEEFTQLDRFAANTFTREVRELREVIDQVFAGNLPFAERSQSSRLATLGHSRGGGIVLLEGSEDSRVKAIATWASVSTFHRYTDSQRKRWISEGFLEVPNTRTGQIMRLNVSLLHDFEKHPENLNITTSVASLGRPLLIVHGEVDLSVTIDNAEVLAAAADPELTTFLRVPKTGHTFGAAHPFERETEALRTIVEETDRFLKEGVER